MNDDFSQKTLLRIAGIDKLDSIDIAPIKESIFDDFRTLETKFREDLEHLKVYLGDLELETKTSDYAYNYKTNSSRETVTAYLKHAHRNAGIEYTVTTEKRWFRAPRHRATLMLSSGNIQEAVTYEIPLDRLPLSSEIVREIVDAMESFSFKVQGSVETDIFLARGVANLTGIDVLAKIFSDRKYTKLGKELNEDVAEKITHLREGLSSLFDSVRTNLDAVIKADPAETAQQHLDEQIAEARQRLEKKADEIERALGYQEEAFQRKHEQKQKELSKALARCQERQDKLDQKLVDHRKKIAENTHLIGPFLEELFPDVEGAYRYRNNATYDHVVDGHLRTFYGLRLREDLRKNPHVEVPQALSLLRTLRRECYPLNSRPVGKNVREIYSGLRALLDYISDYDVSVKHVGGLLAAAAEVRKGKKPDVEPFIEKALGYDFHMGKYIKGLHKKNAKTKTDLGLK